MSMSGEQAIRPSIVGVVRDLRAGADRALGLAGKYEGFRDSVLGRGPVVPRSDVASKSPELPPLIDVLHDLELHLRSALGRMEEVLGSLEGSFGVSQEAQVCRPTAAEVGRRGY